MIGNLLEHYDNALFGLLVPILAPLFFANEDPMTALIWTYGILPLGRVTRPLGSAFFGWVGDFFGRRQALSLSLFGMAIATMSMGCLPTYQDIGLGAPCLLVLGRMLQSFFAAGESTGGAIFVLEQTPMAKRGLISSWYDASSIGGVLLASALVAWGDIIGERQEYWRYLFWGGGVTALFGLFFRSSAAEYPEEIVTLEKRHSRNKWAMDPGQLKPWLAILFASGFSHTTYAIAFTFMNGYIPIVTSFSHAEAVQINTMLLIADFLLLPCFGFLAQKIGKERLMWGGALGSVLAAIPLFTLLDSGSFAIVIAVRMAIVTLGVAFAAPYYAWAVEQVEPSHRCRVLSLGGALGGLLIGAPSSAACLWLHQTGGGSFASGIYLLIAGAFACLALRLGRKKTIVASSVPHTF